MKTEQSLNLALTKYEKELATIRGRIKDVTVWLDASSFMQHQELFIAQVKERDELRRRETELDFMVRFAKWILEKE